MITRTGLSRPSLPITSPGTTTACAITDAAALLPSRAAPVEKEQQILRPREPSTNGDAPRRAAHSNVAQHVSGGGIDDRDISGRSVRCVDPGAVVRDPDSPRPHADV